MPEAPRERPLRCCRPRALRILYAASVASAGDVDGDGYPELVVGSPSEDKVYVYAGGPSGYAEPPATVLAGPATTAFGRAVSGAGDVDGDGYADVVVGTPNAAATAASPVQGGAIVFFGGPMGLSISRSVTLPSYGTSNEQGVGQYVASAGDTNGDGFADVAVFGGLGTVDPQTVIVYMGSPTAFGKSPGVPLQYEGANTAWMGNANLLSCAGDVDGDGYADLAMATPTPPNSQYETDHISLFFGGASGPSRVPSQRLDSTIVLSDHFGMSVAGADFDGTGASDVAVAIVALAAPPLDAQVYEGGAVPALASTVMASYATVQLEREVGAADVDGDGYPDLIVGYPSANTPTGDAGVLHGAVAIFRGSSHGVSLQPSYTLLPPDGTAVAYGASLVRP